jgi:hypothetical protein
MVKSYLLLFCVVSIRVAYAGTYPVPQDEPVVSAKIPEKWKVQQHEEFVEGTTPDGTLHVLVLAVEGKKVAESLGEGVRYIRNTGAIAVKAHSAKHESTTLNGKPLRSVSWDARDQKGEIKLRCHVISGKDGRPALLFFWGSAEADRKYDKEQRQILETIGPA